MSARKGGQPPLDPAAPSVSVHVRVTSPQYDRLYAQAHQQRVTVPEVIRRKLTAPLEPTEDDDQG
jgi:hypothetical protein